MTMKIGSLFAGLVFSLTLAALPATAHELQYKAVLDGPSEAPPNTSPGFGTALITFDLDLVTMRVQASFSDLLGTTTASHIHCCTAAAGTGTAGVATQTPTFIDFPLGVTSGTYDHTFDMTLASSYNPAFVTAHTDVSGSLSALLAGIADGDAYVNIHSTFAPGGEIRGFLAPVPEPATYALMFAGLAVVAIVVKRRRPG